MKIIMNSIIQNRKKRIEELKFAKTSPIVRKTEQIMHNEELLNLYINIGDNYVTAKNMAYTDVYKVKWKSNLANENRVANYINDYRDESKFSLEDLNIFDESAKKIDLEGMVKIIDKYYIYDTSKHKTLKELSYYEPYKSVYEKKYAFLDETLNQLENKIKDSYTGYVSDLQSASTEGSIFYKPTQKEYLSNYEISLCIVDPDVAIKIESNDLD